MVDRGLGRRPRSRKRLQGKRKKPSFFTSWNRHPFPPLFEGEPTRQVLLETNHVVSNEGMWT